MNGFYGALQDSLEGRIVVFCPFVNDANCSWTMQKERYDMSRPHFIDGTAGSSLLWSVVLAGIVALAGSIGAMAIITMFAR